MQPKFKLTLTDLHICLRYMRPIDPTGVRKDDPLQVKDIYLEQTDVDALKKKNIEPNTIVKAEVSLCLCSILLLSLNISLQ